MTFGAGKLTGTLCCRWFDCKLFSGACKLFAGGCTGRLAGAAGGRSTGAASSFADLSAK